VIPAEILKSIRGALGKEGRITALTGAGVSAESGLSTFRDQGGLWEKYPLEEVATPEAFARNPGRVLEFYNLRRRQLKTVQPNPAHLALARLEEALGPRFTLVTQNVDNLHEKAGSRQVLHMHGELVKARCLVCDKVFPWTEDILPADKCNSCGGGLRPHIVWFGEYPFYMDLEIPRALEAEVFLAIGTSGVVYPAAGFVLEARARGKLTVEINLEPTERSRVFDLTIQGPAGARVPELVDALLET
jgi:NAD-dependent deacetylase